MTDKQSNIVKNQSSFLGLLHPCAVAISSEVAQEKGHDPDWKGNIATFMYSETSEKPDP